MLEVLVLDLKEKLEFSILEASSRLSSNSGLLQKKSHGRVNSINNEHILLRQETISDKKSRMMFESIKEEEEEVDGIKRSSKIKKSGSDTNLNRKSATDEPLLKENSQVTALPVKHSDCRCNQERTGKFAIPDSPSSLKLHLFQDVEGTLSKAESHEQSKADKTIKKLQECRASLAEFVRTDHSFTNPSTHSQFKRNFQNSSTKSLILARDSLKKESDQGSFAPI